MIWIARAVFVIAASVSRRLRSPAWRERSQASLNDSMMHARNMIDREKGRPLTFPNADRPKPIKPPPRPARLRFRPF